MAPPLSCTHVVRVIGYGRADKDASEDPERRGDQADALLRARVVLQHIDALHGEKRRAEAKEERDDCSYCGSAGDLAEFV